MTRTYRTYFFVGPTLHYQSHQKTIYGEVVRGCCNLPRIPHVASTQLCLMLPAPRQTLAKIAKALISIHHYEDFFGIIFKQRDTCGPIFSELLLELLFLQVTQKRI